jgi:hypothetical protein
MPSHRLDAFIAGVFHNVGDLVSHHRQLLDKLYAIQLQEHPVITSITAALLDTLLNAREAYVAYIENYPMAVYRVEEEMESNATFADFLEVRLISARLTTLLINSWMQRASRHPGARRQDLHTHICRPILRLLRYWLSMEKVLMEASEGHEDWQSIPQLLGVIELLVRDSTPEMTRASQEVALLRSSSSLAAYPTNTMERCQDGVLEMRA